MNLLPWRQQRQARCVRLWGLLFAGSLSMVLISAFSLRGNQALTLKALRLELAGVLAVQNTLEARQAYRQDRQQQQEGTLWFPTQAWPTALVSLAQAIPSQAWLTQLRYQPPSLILTGYAATLPALSGMNDALRQVAGFTPGPSGALQQDNQGRWTFTFQLKGRG